MNITVPFKPFAKALAIVAPVSPSNPSQRALACVHITAGDTITLRTTDLVTFAQATSDGEVNKPGSALVSTKALADAIRVLPAASSSVTIEVKDDKLRLSCGKARHAIATLDPDEFPTWPHAFELGAIVNPAELHRAIKIVEHAASGDETRPRLAAIKMIADGKTLTLVTTDGHRLAKTAMPCDATFDLLVPAKSAATLLRVLDSATGEVRFGTDGATYAGLRTDAHEIVVRTHDAATFPPWSQVVPAQSKTRATLSRELFIAALRNVEVAARTNVKDAGTVSMVRVSLTAGEVTLDGANTDGAVANDEIDCDYAGKPLTFGANAVYMLHALNALTSDDVTIDIAGELDPMRIEPVSDDPSLLIVMPARL